MALPRMWRLSLAWPPTVRRSMSLVPRERKAEMTWIGSAEPSSAWISQTRSMRSGSISVGSSLRQSRSIQLIFCIASGMRLPFFMYWMVSVSLVLTP